MRQKLTMLLVAGFVVSGTGTKPLGVIEKSSTAKPSSEPGIRSESAQRIQKLAPLAILRPVMVKLTAVRFGDTLPLRAPTVPATTGLEKSKLL